MLLKNVTKMPTKRIVGHFWTLYARGKHVTENVAKIPTKHNVILTWCACMSLFDVYSRGNHVTKNVTKMPTKCMSVFELICTW